MEFDDKTWATTKWNLTTKLKPIEWNLMLKLKPQHRSTLASHPVPSWFCYKTINTRGNEIFILHGQWKISKATQQKLSILGIKKHGHTGPWFNIKMLSYQYMYRKYHCGDKTVVRSCYLHNHISYNGNFGIFVLNQGPAFHNTVEPNKKVIFQQDIVTKDTP